jgi:hypothetical protein
MKDGWDKFDVINKFITGLGLGLIALVVKCGTDKIAQSNAEAAQQLNRGTFVKQLITDLTASDSKVHQDIALIALDHYIGETDSALVLQIAEDIFQDKIQRDTGQNLAYTAQMALSIISKRDSIRGKQLGQQVLDIISAKISADSLGQTPARNSSQARVAAAIFKKLVFIQYTNPEEKDLMKALMDSCNIKGWKVPAIEQVSKNNVNEVRYFHTEDEEFAKKVAGFVNGFSSRHGKKSTMTVVNESAKNFRSPQGQVEVWVK